MPSFEGLLMVTKIELNWIDHDWSLLTCDNWQLDLNPRHIDDFTTWQFQLDWFSVAKRGGHWTTSSEADLGYVSIKQWSMGGGLAKLGIATGWQTNARTHTQNYPWPWFLDEVEDITNREGRFNGPIYRLNDLNVVIICIRCFQCLMIIIIILFKAIVLHFLMRDIGYQTLFSKSSTNQNPPLMMDCPALPRFKFTAPGEKATHFTPQWWPCCFSTWAVWFFFWKWDFRSKE